VAAAARAGMFAADSAAAAKRLTPEQREEWRFLKVASATGRFELDAARLALARSKNAGVRSLATTIVDHHAGTQPRLHQLLGARNMAPAMLSNDQRKALNRLAKLQGAKFDRTWLEWVALRSQQEGVLTYERAAQALHDPTVVEWVEDALPMMRENLEAAERISPRQARAVALKFSPASTAPNTR
jgi:putative membrane protein